MENIYYISHTRFPSGKAHSIYIAKHCESFAKLGHAVTLLIPRRFGIVKQNYKSFYGVTSDFTIKKLPVVDLLSLPYIKVLAHRLGVVTFGIGVFFYALLYIPKNAFIFTPDILIAFVVSFTHTKVIYEIHDYPTKSFWLYRLVTKRIYKIQTNNHQKVHRVVEDFNISEHKVFSVHNGVTIEDFNIDISTLEARRELGLQKKVQYAVYTGHLYGWKGVDTLAQAAPYMPELIVLFVGGTKEDVARMKKKYKDTPNLEFTGYKEHTRMPLYQKAANVLVVPNTAKKDISKFHTSPMKVFEYMASRKPIVASGIPSLREILSEENAILVHADSPQQLAKAITNTIEHPSTQKVQQAFEDVSAYTWDKRADKIMDNLRKADK